MAVLDHGYAPVIRAHYQGMCACVCGYTTHDDHTISHVMLKLKCFIDEDGYTHMYDRCI